VLSRLHDLQTRGIHIRTLEGLIPTWSLGKMAPLVMGLLTGLAEVERELVRERMLDSIAHREAAGGGLRGRRRSYSPKTGRASAEAPRRRSIHLPQSQLELSRAWCVLGRSQLTA